MFLSEIRTALMKQRRVSAWWNLLFRKWAPRVFGQEKHCHMPQSLHAVGWCCCEKNICWLAILVRWNQRGVWKGFHLQCSREAETCCTCKRFEQARQIACTDIMYLDTMSVEHHPKVRCPDRHTRSTGSENLAKRPAFVVANPLILRAHCATNLDGNGFQLDTIMWQRLR